MEIVSTLVFSKVFFRLIVLSTNLEYKARERQRKSGRPAKLSEKKGDRDLEREIKKKREKKNKGDIVFVGRIT